MFVFAQLSGLSLANMLALPQHAPVFICWRGSGVHVNCFGSMGRDPPISCVVSLRNGVVIILPCLASDLGP